MKLNTGSEKNVGIEIEKNTGIENNTRTEKTLWSELLPHEFKKRMTACPTVYLPLGICEPHGQISAFGLDTMKAEWLCQEAAKKIGGIVAPSMGYHIHESGYHAAWLEETVGEENPHMTAMPPAIFLSFFLYQLRSFVNAGFKTIVVISGHSGGNQVDLRSAANVFMKYIPVQIYVKSDPELVEGLYAGDHAGRYEISQLMYLRPELIDMKALSYEQTEGSGGRLALGSDAEEASPELGENIMKACLDAMCSDVSQIIEKNKSQETSQIEQTKKLEQTNKVEQTKISYTAMESIWNEFLKTSSEWMTSNPWPGQQEVSSHSQWKPYEKSRPK